MTDEIFEALLVIFGKENDFWIPAIVDTVEWTDPSFFHQN